MPLTVPDTAIWAVLLFSAGFAFSYIPATLEHVKTLAEAPDSSNDGPNKQLQKDAEKALSINTLKTLSDGYSYDIRSAAIKIVTNRVLNSRTKQLLLSDLASTDAHRRDNAINALNLLIPRREYLDADTASHFADYASFSAIVEALRNLLPLHDRNTTESEASAKLLPPSPIFPPNRPSQEKKLLRILTDLIWTFFTDSDRYDRRQIITSLLKAGIVTRWLKDYPFPCARPEAQRWNFKKADVYDLFSDRAWSSEDLQMAQIMHAVNSTTTGIKQFLEAGLRKNTVSLSRWGFSNPPESDPDIRMVNGESTAGHVTMDEVLSGNGALVIDLVDHPAGESSGQLDHAIQRRPSSLSPEEENLRRRRREAIVVADAGVPLRRENILERHDSWTPLVATASPPILDELAITNIPQEALPVSSDRITNAPVGSTLEGSHPIYLEEGAQQSNSDSALLTSLGQVLHQATEPRYLDDLATTSASNSSILYLDSVERLRQEEAEGEAAFNRTLRAPDPEHEDTVGGDDVEQS